MLSIKNGLGKITVILPTTISPNRGYYGVDIAWSGAWGLVDGPLLVIVHVNVGGRASFFLFVPPPPPPPLPKLFRLADWKSASSLGLA